jgi:DNA polymerase
MMIEYGWLSRNVRDPKKFEEVRDRRIEYKKVKDPRQAPLKLVLNGTYGASKDKYNALYDPRQANNVCVNGQLLLLDLMEKLEDHCEIIQSNTDGILVRLYDRSDFYLIDDIAWEWEERTGMRLEFDIFKEVFQKDVNNYVMVAEDGSFKTKGGYVKKLNDLDYDLAIVNKALVAYMTKGVPIEDTVMGCKDLRDFQKIVKISYKYMHGTHNGRKLTDKTFRVFASKDPSDGPIRKVKSLDKNPEKFANTPERCFIHNESVLRQPLPEKLDKSWYVDLANERLAQFGVR